MRPSTATGCCTLENGTNATPETHRKVSSYSAALPSQQQQQHQQFPRYFSKQHQPLRHAASISWSTQQRGNFNGVPRGVVGGIAHAHTHTPPHTPTTSALTTQLTAVHHHRSLHAAAVPAFHHHHVNNYAVMRPPSLLPAEMVASHNYANLPPSNNINQQRINECAGIPLISNASSHLTPAQRQRLQRKSSHSPAAHQKTAVVPPLILGEPLIGNNYNWHMSGLYAARHGGGCIAQLAAHAQGMPLLLQKQQHLSSSGSTTQWGISGNGVTYMPTNTNCSHSAHLNGFPSHSTVTKAKADKPLRTTLRYQYSAPAALSTRGKEHAAQCAQDLNRQGDVTKNDDGVGETCLPRIIKPRKRRKKDRKPANGVFLKLDSVELLGDTHKGGHMRLDSSQPQQQLSTDQLQCHRNGNNGNICKPLSLKPNSNSAAALPCSSNQHIRNDFTQTQQQQAHVYYDHNSQLDQHLPLATSLNNSVHQSSSPPHCSHDGHGVCFCIECDPLRLIWDYPLRRSLSDSSATSTRTKSSTSSNASSDMASSCSSTQASDTDNNAITPTSGLRSRADIVGVIGSNRRESHDSSSSNKDCLQYMRKQLTVANSSNNKNNSNSNTYKSATNGCLSDSNDSGYGDILSGITFADDLFSHSYNALSSVDTLPTSTAPATTDFGDSAASLLLLPTTAETLLTESINEISRKLIETCVNELPELSEVPAQTGPGRSFSGCGSELSTDSGIGSAAIVNGDELVFKFDGLNIVDAFETAAISSSAGENFLNLPKFPGNDKNYIISSNMDLLFDLNNNHKPDNCNDTLLQLDKHERQQQEQQQQHSQQFINNCFDLVWPNTYERCIGNAITATAAAVNDDLVK